MTAKQILSAAAAMLLAGAVPAAATTVTLDLRGTVTSATGAWDGDVGEEVFGAITFDTDPANATVIEDVSGDPNELAETYWTFSGGSYGGNLNGALTPTSSDYVILETIDNIDFDLLGNPFGLTGIRDVLGFTFGDAIATCDPSEQNAAGLCPPSSGTVSGEDVSIFITASSDWFSGGNVIPVLSDLLLLDPNLRIVGQGTQFLNGNEAATAQFSIAVPDASPVPLPAGVWLLLTGVVGLVAPRVLRRRA